MTGRRGFRLFPRGGWSALKVEKSVRRVLPRSLLGRSLLIVLFPLLITQGIALELYYGNFLKVVSRRLTGSVTAVIVLSLYALQRLKNTTDHDWHITPAHHHRPPIEI